MSEQIVRCQVIDRELPFERCVENYRAAAYRCCTGCPVGRQNSLLIQPTTKNEEEVLMRKREVRDGKLKCSKCEEWKPPERFTTKTKDSEERRERCKDCVNEYNRNRNRRLSTTRMATEAPDGQPLPLVVPGAACGMEPVPRQETPAPVVPQEMPIPSHECRKGGVLIDPRGISYFEVPDEDAVLERQLLLDFSDYPQILEKIKHIAHYEERTPENQIRWLLRKWFGDLGPKPRYETNDMIL